MAVVLEERGANSSDLWQQRRKGKAEGRRNTRERERKKENMAGGERVLERAGEDEKRG